MLTPTLQLGDGGWAILSQAQAFQQVFARTSVYASGVYLASLRQHTDEVFQGLLVSVPDVYSVRAGLAYGLAPDQGLSLSVGGRIDGTTVSDLIGGRDDYKRDAGYYVYVEPGLAEAKPEERFQFERHGYFVADMLDHQPGRPVFNRTVTLRDSWSKSPGA